MDVSTWFSHRSSFDVSVDIATAASLLASAYFFIRNQSKENKEMISEERENLRVERLIDVRVELSSLMETYFLHFSEYKTSRKSISGEMLLSIYNSLSRKILPTMLLLGGSGKAWTITKSLVDRSYYNKFNPDMFLISLCTIKFNIMMQIRGLMVNEVQNNLSEIEDAFKDYILNKYFYIGNQQLIDRKTLSKYMSEIG